MLDEGHVHLMALHVRLIMSKPEVIGVLPRELERAAGHSHYTVRPTLEQWDLSPGSH